MTSLLVHIAEIGIAFIRPEVIGDFPEDEARHFFTDLAMPRQKKKVELSDDGWTKVWEVWGHIRSINLHMLADPLHTVRLLFCFVMRLHE